MAKYIYKHRRGTTAQWENNSTKIPYEGEIVIELDDVNGLHKLKIGDGIHTYSELAYLKAGDEIVSQVLADVRPRIVTVELSLNWAAKDNKYSQIIALDGITSRSRLDLQPSVDMVEELRQLGVVFVTENNGGVITVYSVGNMPTKTYTMQATIVETECANEDVIIGIPIGSASSTKISELNDDVGLITINNLESEVSKQIEKAMAGADFITNGIEKIEKTATNGLIDTYTITLTDGSASTFTVTNGKDGDPYVLTDADKQVIVNDVLASFINASEVAM